MSKSDIIFCTIFSAVIIVAPYILGLVTWGKEYRRYKKEMMENWLYHPLKPDLQDNEWIQLGMLLLLSYGLSFIATGLVSLLL